MCWLVRQWASWQGMQTLHRGLDREGKDSVDGRQGDDDGRLALQQPALQHTYTAARTVPCTVGYCWVWRLCDDTCYPLVQVSLDGKGTLVREQYYTVVYPPVGCRARTLSAMMPHGVVQVVRIIINDRRLLYYTGSISRANQFAAKHETRTSG